MGGGGRREEEDWEEEEFITRYFRGPKVTVKYKQYIHIPWQPPCTVNDYHIPCHRKTRGALRQ